MMSTRREKRLPSASPRQSSPARETQIGCCSRLWSWILAPNGPESRNRPGPMTLWIHRRAIRRARLRPADNLVAAGVASRLPLVQIDTQAGAVGGIEVSPPYLGAAREHRLLLLGEGRPFPH